MSIRATSSKVRGRSGRRLDRPGMGDRSVPGRCREPLQGRSVGMGRLEAAVAMVVLLASCPGCGLAPRNFRKANHPAPLVRARAVGLGSTRPSAEVIPVLVARLNDPDVVVRMAAHEELKRRTGRDFGFRPWASDWERADAVNRWRAWLGASPTVPAPAPSRPGAPPQPRKSLPRPSTQMQ